MVTAALVAAAAALLLVALAELAHLRRVRAVAALVFGPAQRPTLLSRSAPFLRTIAAGSAAWGLTTLLLLPPMKHSVDGAAPTRGEPDHILLVLDVSPSMRLVDAGTSKDQSRMARARVLMESFFSRVPIDRFSTSVVAVYNGAMPVVIDTLDSDVVNNILGDLPLHYAFPTGKTRLFAGLEEAARTAKNWSPGSTTLIVLSDGDTVPGTGMPAMPASVARVLVVGVGDPSVGKFIDGRQSRQDQNTLRQIALRLSGEYHNGNEKHLPTELLNRLFESGGSTLLERLTMREYALFASAFGTALLALLPWLLHRFGSRFRPGVTGHDSPARRSIPLDRQQKTMSAFGATAANAARSPLS